MHFSIFDTIVVIVYLIGIGGIGIYQARKVHGSGDFFAGGRKFNKFLMIMHNLGTGTHADDPVVVAGASYQRGFSGIWYTFVYLFITPFYWIIAPYFRRSRFLTTSDFFEARFGERLGLLYAIMSIVIFTINMGTMLKGSGTIVQAVTQGAVPEWVAVVGMAVVFISYGTAGGLVATVITESIQGLLIVVMSLLLVPFGLYKIGGFSGLHQLLDADKFNLSGPQEFSILWIIAAMIANLVGIVAQPHVMEICSTGKTEWEGRIGFTYGAFIKRFCSLGWMMTGVIVLAMVGKGLIDPLPARELAFGTAIRNLLPVGFIGLMFASILAAQMAALSAFMVAASALFSRNIYRKWLHPQATDAQVVKTARYSGLVIVATGTLFAFIVPGVADALIYFWTVATFLGTFVWAGVIWRKTNEIGAWLSFFTMILIWTLVGPIGIKFHQIFPDVAWLGIYGTKDAFPMLLISYLPAGIIMLIAGSLLGKPRDKKILDDFYQLLKTPVGQEQKLIDAGINIVYAGQSEGHRWELNHPRLVNWLGFLVALIVTLGFFGILFILAALGS